MFLKIGNMAETLKKSRKLWMEIAVYSAAAIFGPMIFFGVAGYFIDRSLGTGRKFLLAGMFVAWISTNVILFVKRRSVSREVMGNFSPKE